VEIYRANYWTPPKDILTKVVLRDPTETLPHGLRVGVHRSTVESILGRSDESSADTSIYAVAEENNEAGEDAISFSFENDKVTRITWGFYVE
jgi:hypothetical protein